MNCGWYRISERKIFTKYITWKTFECWLLIVDCWYGFALYWINNNCIFTIHNATQHNKVMTIIFDMVQHFIAIFIQPICVYYCYRKHSVCWLKNMVNRWKTDHKYQQHIQIQWNGKQFEIFLFFNVQCSTTIDRIGSSSCNGF